MRYIESYKPDDLIRHGPLVEVTLELTRSTISNRQSRGQALSPPMTVQMLIDTGAQLTALEESIPKQLGLEPLYHTLVTGVSQEAQTCPAYVMVLTFEMIDTNGQKKVCTRESEVIGVNIPPSPHPHVGLLGRDFLKHFRFVYEGDTGSFELTFPTPSE